MGINVNMFAIQNGIDGNYLEVKLQDTEQLDQIAMKVIEKDTPEFLIPFRITTVNGEVVLKYKLVNATALKYTNMILPKNIFIQMYCNLLVPFLKGKDWFLNPHNICIDPQYIFCDNYTYKVYLIYIPEKTYINTDEEIMNFFKKVFANTTISDDKDFQVNLFRFFANEEATLSDLYRMLKEECERKMESGQAIPKPMAKTFSVAPIPAAKVVAPSSSAKTVKKEKKTEEMISDVKEKEANRSVIEELFSDKKKEKKKDKKKAFGIFGKKKEGDIQKKEEANPLEHGESMSFPSVSEISSLPLCQIEESDVTEIKGGVFGNVTASLELIDSAVPGAMQRIVLDFRGEYAIVGRISADEIKPEIAFPSEFKRIGRRHARIERRGEEYYIIDLGSMNHTLLNGQILVPNQPYRLQNGMELTFTDSKPVRYKVRL